MNPNICILVDCQQFMHRWVHWLARPYAKRGEQYLVTPDQEKELVVGVMSSLINDINRYKHHIDRIYLVTDAPFTWRKLIKIEEADTFYKSDRKKDHNFDYKKFLGIMNEFLGIMRENDIYVLSCDNFEADDIIGYLVKQMYIQGQSSVILSSDSDLKQLICTNEDAFVCVYDPDLNKKKHYVDKYVTTDGSGPLSITEDFDSFGEIVEEDPLCVDLEGSFTGQRAEYSKLLNSIYDVSDTINPFHVIFCKMLAGDKTDNVPAVYYKPVANGHHAFTELRANNLFGPIEKEVNHAYFLNLWNSEPDRRELASQVLAEVQSKDIAKIGHIADNIKRNIQFVYLNDVVYDENLTKQLKDFGSKLFTDKERLVKHKYAIGSGLTWEMLRGTRFESRNSSAIDYDTRNSNRY